MHINQRADMSIFNGTPYEGLTYMQVRRKLTPEQVAKVKMLTKRNRKVARMAQNMRRLVATYK